MNIKTIIIPIIVLLIGLIIWKPLPTIIGTIITFVMLYAIEHKAQPERYIRPYIPPKLRLQILHRDNYTCQRCGQKAPQIEIEIDHIVPVCKGGMTIVDNLQTLCFNCNRGKGADRYDT